MKTCIICNKPIIRKSTSPIKYKRKPVCSHKCYKTLMSQIPFEKRNIHNKYVKEINDTLNGTILELNKHCNKYCPDIKKENINYEIEMLSGKSKKMFDKSTKWNKREKHIMILVLPEIKYIDKIYIYYNKLYTEVKYNE